MPVTATTSSPPESGFIPRKEFVRDENSSPPNSFALLAISGSNFVRLYSFDQAVVDSLQRLFEAQGTEAVTREDPQYNLYEFVLDGKPWANPKSVATEKLLIDILALIYQSGFTFLSCIDYGREHDDRLAMAFSKPSALPRSRSPTPLPPPSPFSLGAPNGSPPDSPPKVALAARRVPFALSFSSTTVMRVISPPLHLTPAILQAVRSAWPRGVVSEKKVSGDSYEFKLKGYKWFQQDNFASDSLRHILTLLSSLDAYSLSLLTSLSLTNRSRVKDLWVFTGPAPETSAVDSSSLLRTDSSTMQPGGLQHRRLASEPLTLGISSPSRHNRTATESNVGHQRQPSTPTTPLSAGLLRKPAPRAQIPVSVVHERDSDLNPDDDGPSNRLNLPSTVPSAVENMTGVGTGLRHPTERSFEPPAAFRAAQERAARLRSPSPSQNSSAPPTNTQSVALPLLSGNPFRGESGDYRDSTLSQATDVSLDIPGKWTGAIGGDTLRGLQRKPGERWQGPSSVDEDEDPLTNTPKPHHRFGSPDASKTFPNQHAKLGTGEVTTPIYETLGRVESPEIVQVDMYAKGLRRSEAALVSMIAATSVHPSPSNGTPQSADSGSGKTSGHLPPGLPLPTLNSNTSAGSSGSGHGRDGGQERESRSSGEHQRTPAKLIKPNDGQGWVLVNVANRLDASPAGQSGPDAPPFKQADSRASSSVTPVDPTPIASKFISSPKPVSTEQHAKAIAAMDANASSESSLSTAGEKKGGVRRFFSLSRRPSRKRLNRGIESPSEEHFEGSSIRSPSMGGRTRSQSTTATSRTNRTAAMAPPVESTSRIARPASPIAASPPEDEIQSPPIISSTGATTAATPQTTLPRSPFRDRLRRFGTPAASRKHDARMSFD